MIREGLITALALAGGIAFIAGEAPPAQSLRDDFDRGIAPQWAARQEIEGSVATTTVAGRGGVLVARAGPRRGRVPKAALIARPSPLRIGDSVRVAFDLFAPVGAPLDSLQIVDLECASCGEAGNPGIRLYLRRGRLRIDRSKIGIRHAWTNDAAPALTAGRWHHIEWLVTIGSGDDGRVQVSLDGRPVLAARGATILPSADHADRLQIGITANSNAVPATLMFDNVDLSARRRRS